MANVFPPIVAEIVFLLPTEDSERKLTKLRNNGRVGTYEDYITRLALHSHMGAHSL